MHAKREYNTLNNSASCLMLMLEKLFQAKQYITVKADNERVSILGFCIVEIVETCNNFYCRLLYCNLRCFKNKN